MMLISEFAASLTVSTASSISNNVRFLPPVTLTIAFVAPSIVASSKLLATAWRAASIALFSPALQPIPMIAVPLFSITVLTSAKSRLITPVTAIRSDIDCTPRWSTLSTSLNASSKLVVLSMISLSLSLGIMISESTWPLNSSRPTKAFSILLLPSNLNGLVTIPTVKAPSSWAISAIIGAAPVPVPPPRPQATNTMSAPCSASSSSFLLSRAAALPTSGLAPAPLPPVMFLPIWILFWHSELLRTCKSVFTT